MKAVRRPSLGWTFGYVGLVVGLAAGCGDSNSSTNGGGSTGAGGALSSGGVGGAGGWSGTGGAQSTAATGVMVTTLAGSADAPRGYADGMGTAARFSSPVGLAVDQAGNLFVADGNSVIRKITPAGVVTTLAGAAGLGGSVDGIGSAARFGGPVGVAVDGAGNVYVAEEGNSVIRKITPAGVVTTLAGTAGSIGSVDGVGPSARFSRPQDVAVDSAGNVYVVDMDNNTIRRITPAGVVTTFAGSAGLYGYADGVGSAALFSQPMGLAIDTAGNLFVADEGNSAIRKITPAGVVTTLAGRASSPGNIDGTGTAAGFSLPYDVATDASGNVIVADTVNNTIRKVTTAGVVTTVAGSIIATPLGGPRGDMGSADGPGPSAEFYNPMGVAVDAAGNIFVADTLNNTIRKITPAGK